MVNINKRSVCIEDYAWQKVKAGQAMSFKLRTWSLITLEIIQGCRQGRRGARSALIFPSTEQTTCMDCGRGTG